MKNFLIYFFILLSTALFGQTSIPTSGMNGTITNNTPLGGNVYQLTISSIDDQSDVNFDGTNIAADGKWVIWNDCERFVVTSTTCGSCLLVPTTVIVEVTADDAGNSAPGIGLVTIINETPNNGLGAFVGGTDDPDNQCIANYYMNKIDNLQSDSPVRDTIVQAAHGFVALTPVRQVAGTFVGADADAVLAAEGVVIESIDANTFVLGRQGSFTVPAHGLSIDTTYYLSNAAGAIVPYSGRPANEQQLFTPKDVNTVVLHGYQLFELDSETSQQVEAPAITITGTGATATLSRVPIASSRVVAYVNGQTIDALSGSGMSVVSTAVTFDNATLGFNITATDRIVFDYEILDVGDVVEALTLTITAGGATATLANTPLDDTEIIVSIDGLMVDALAGSGMTTAGTALTFDNATLGFVLTGAERVIAYYRN